MELPELMSVKELRKFLGIGKDKAYALVKDKGFPSVKIGGQHYVMKDEFVAWLARRTSCRSDRLCRPMCNAVATTTRIPLTSERRR